MKFSVSKTLVNIPELADIYLNESIKVKQPKLTEIKFSFLVNTVTNNIQSALLLIKILAIEYYRNILYFRKIPTIDALFPSFFLKPKLHASFPELVIFSGN